MQFIRKHWAVILLALIPLIPLWRCVFLGEVIGPWDQMWAMPPWTPPYGDRPAIGPWDPLQADACLQFYGWRSLVFESWSNFRIPFWNPYELCGTVLLANSQSGGFYPLHIVAGVLQLPAGLAITLLAWFHLAWAGLGVRKLALSMGSNQDGAFLAGASFTLSSFMLSWAGLASVPTTVSWIPWILAFGLELGTLRESKLPLAKLSVCIAMLLLGGHLQFAAYGLMALVVLMLVRVSLKQAPVASMIPAVVGLALGAMLAAPQLGPVMQMTKNSHRANTPTEEGYSAYSKSGFMVSELFSVVNPAALGDTTKYEDQDSRTDSAAWPQRFKAGANPAESAIGVGGVLLVLALFGLRRKGVQMPVLGVGLLGFLLAVPSLLAQAAYFYLPGWSATGSPGRAIVLFVLATCALAGVGWSRWHEESPSSRVKLLWLSAMFLAPFIALVGPALLPASSGPRHEVQGAAMLTAFETLPAGLGMAGLALLGLMVQRATRAVVIIYPLMAYLVFGLFKVITSGVPPTMPTAPDGRVAIIPEFWSLYMNPGALLPPNMATIGRFREAGGYDSMIHRDTAALISKVNGGPTSPPENGNMMFIMHNASMETLTELGVSEVWSLRPIDGLQSKEDASGMFVHKLNGQYADSAGHQLKPMRNEPGFIELRVSGTDPVIVRERNLPGWTATIEGKPVPVDGPWLSVQPKEPGTHHITFKYAPPMMLWFLLFIAGLAGVTLLAHRPVVQYKHEPDRT